ncbi:flavodoxin domain-containing protein [Pseudobutyrivibrio xylanivorans]|uniref:Flavodoxin domain-containing protein n=1 Tax=Pseudobutyrivibrio xylanivorans DSM 14809 TaxID=1123012 RepID=A0A1M6IB32_PSEXY|nr:flavodoxin domain-containing protein [Pseudobutyrivibrio xylanivorans]SHJ31583.1 Flavodoxin domain-containing protein [Pseudobutyrivibrio xylanivorans DSM 14809]
MKGIVIYKSKYGATKRYAQWIAEETGFDIVDVKHAKIEDIKEYDTVVFGGGLYAQGIAGLSFLKKHIDALKDKQLYVFCDGASPIEEGAISFIFDQNMKDYLKMLPFFYFRGGWDMDNMSFVDRNLCKMLQKSVAKKDPKDYEIWEKALMDAGTDKHDWTDKSYIKPLIEAINTSYIS